MRKISCDYSQYESNNTVAFALASMRYDVNERIEVRRHRPQAYPEILSVGSPMKIMEQCGDMRISCSFITSQGRLMIEVE